MTQKKLPISEKAARTGFCFGVRQAITLLEKIARERGGVETLGAVAHNQQVLHKLEQQGVKVVNNIEDVQGDTIVTSSHGVSPELEASLLARNLKVVTPTCHHVHRAQAAAEKLAESGFFVIVFGAA